MEASSACSSSAAAAAAAAGGGGDGLIHDSASLMRHLRRLFSPQDAIKKDGSINQAYFRPKRPSQVWSDKDKLLFIKGVQQFGVGAWEEVVEEYLPHRDVVSVRLYACRLLGRQRLDELVGWKPTEEEIRAKFEEHKEKAMQLGLWVNEVWLDDAYGKPLPLKRKVDEVDGQEQGEQQSVKKAKLGVAGEGEAVEAVLEDNSNAGAVTQAAAEAAASSSSSSPPPTDSST